VIAIAICGGPEDRERSPIDEQTPVGERTRLRCQLIITFHTRIGLHVSRGRSRVGVVDTRERFDKTNWLRVGESLG
jgi:hypothetical protein